MEFVDRRHAGRLLAAQLLHGFPAAEEAPRRFTRFAGAEDDLAAQRAPETDPTAL